MAKQEITEELAAEAPAAVSTRKKNLMMAGILVGVMLLEGFGVFFLARYFGGKPQAALAADLQGLDPNGGEKAPVDLELEIVKFRAQNEKSQPAAVYEMTIAAVVGEKSQAKVAELLARKRATIQDRLSRVVRAMDPQRFSEPDLATLRQQFQYELSQIAGEEGAIKEVLIPSIVRYSGD